MALFFLGHARRYTEVAQIFDETDNDITLVATQRRAGFDASSGHDERSVAFGCAARQRGGGVDHQAVAVLHQRVAQVAQVGLGAASDYAP